MASSIAPWAPSIHADSDDSDSDDESLIAASRQRKSVPTPTPATDGVLAASAGTKTRMAGRVDKLEYPRHVVPTSAPDYVKHVVGPAAPAKFKILETPSLLAVLRAVRGPTANKSSGVVALSGFANPEVVIAWLDANMLGIYGATTLATYVAEVKKGYDDDPIKTVATSNWFVDLFAIAQKRCLVLTNDDIVRVEGLAVKMAEAAAIPHENISDFVSNIAKAYDPSMGTSINNAAKPALREIVTIIGSEIYPQALGDPAVIFFMQIRAACIALLNKWTSMYTKPIPFFMSANHSVTNRS